LRRYASSDDHIARVEHLLPSRPGQVGRNSDKGNRLFVGAVIWRFRCAQARDDERLLDPIGGLQFLVSLMLHRLRAVFARFS
jgi:hypothetical protein